MTLSQKDIRDVADLVAKKLEMYMNQERREARFDPLGAYRTTPKMHKYDLLYKVMEAVDMDRDSPRYKTPRGHKSRSPFRGYPAPLFSSPPKSKSRSPRGKSKERRRERKKSKEKRRLATSPGRDSSPEVKGLEEKSDTELEAAEAKPRRGRQHKSRSHVREGSQEDVYRINPHVEQDSLRVIPNKEADRLTLHANEILSEVPIDKLQVIHRYRPNANDIPNITENGKVQNYTRHVGSALHTTKYIDYYMQEGLQCGKKEYAKRLQDLKGSREMDSKKRQESSRHEDLPHRRRHRLISANAKDVLSPRSTPSLQSSRTSMSLPSRYTSSTFESALKTDACTPLPQIQAKGSLIAGEMSENSAAPASVPPSAGKPEEEHPMERPASRESVLSQRARLTESASDMPVPSRDVTVSESMVAISDGGTIGEKRYTSQERAREGENVEYYSFSKERCTDTDTGRGTSRKVDEGDVSISVNSSIDNITRIDSFYEDDVPQPEEVRPVAPAATHLEKKASKRDEPDSAREDRSAASNKSRSRHDHEKSEASSTRKWNDQDESVRSRSSSRRSSHASVVNEDHTESEKTHPSSRMESKSLSKSSSRHGRHRHRSSSRDNSERRRSKSRESRKSTQHSASRDLSERHRSKSPPSHRSDSTLAEGHNYSSDFTESEDGDRSHKSIVLDRSKASSRPTSGRSYQSHDRSQRSLHEESREQPTGGSQASLDKASVEKRYSESQRIQDSRRDDDDESGRSGSGYSSRSVSARSNVSAAENRERTGRDSRSSVRSQQRLASQHDEGQGHTVDFGGNSVRSSTPKGSLSQEYAEAEVSQATADCSTHQRIHRDCSLKHTSAEKTTNPDDSLVRAKPKSRTSSAGSSRSGEKSPVPSLNLEGSSRKKRGGIHNAERGHDINHRDDGRGFHPYPGIPPPKPERRGSVSEMSSPDSGHRESTVNAVKYKVSTESRGAPTEPVDPATLKEYYVTEDEASITDRSFISEKSHVLSEHSMASAHSFLVHSRVSASDRGGESTNKDKFFSASSGKRTPVHEVRYEYSSDDFYNDSKSDITHEDEEDVEARQVSRRSSVVSARSKQSVGSVGSRGSRKDKGGISSAETATKRGKDTENHQDSFHSDFSDEWREDPQEERLPEATEDVPSVNDIQPANNGEVYLDKSEGFIPLAAPGASQTGTELDSTGKTVSRSGSAGSHGSQREDTTDYVHPTPSAELDVDGAAEDRPSSRTGSVRSRDDQEDKVSSRAASAMSRTSNQEIQARITAGSQASSRAATPEGDSAPQRMSRSGSAASRGSVLEDNVPASQSPNQMKRTERAPRIGSAASLGSLYDTYPSPSSPASYPASMADSPKSQGTPEKPVRIGSAASRGSFQEMLQQGRDSPSERPSGRLEFGNAGDSVKKPPRAPSQNSMYDTYPPESSPASWPASLASSPKSETSTRKVPRVGSAASRDSLYDTYPPENTPASYPASLDNFPLMERPAETVNRPDSVASRTSLYDTYPPESSPASWPASLAGSPKNEKVPLKATRKGSAASRSSLYDTYPPESSPASWPASLAGSPKTMSPQEKRKRFESRASRDSLFDTYPPESSPASRPSSRMDSPICQVIERDVGLTRIGSAGSLSGKGEVRQPVAGEAVDLSRPGSALSQGIQSPRDNCAPVECIVDVGVDRHVDSNKGGSRRSSHHSRVSSLGEDIGPLAQSTARTESKPANRPASALSRGSARDSPRIAADVNSRRESIFSQSESEVSELQTFRVDVASADIPDSAQDGMYQGDQNAGSTSQEQQEQSPETNREEVSKSVEEPKHSESAYYSRPSSDSSDSKTEVADPPVSCRENDTSFKGDVDTAALDGKSAEPADAVERKTSRPLSSSSTTSNKSSASKQLEGAILDLKASESKRSSRRGSKVSTSSDKGSQDVKTHESPVEKAGSRKGSVTSTASATLPVESTAQAEERVLTRKDSVCSIGSIKSDPPSMVIAFPGEDFPASRASPVPARRQSTGSEASGQGSTTKKPSRHDSISSQQSTTDVTAERHTRKDSVSSQRSTSETGAGKKDQHSPKKMEKEGRRSRRSSNASCQSVEGRPIETVTYSPTEPLRAEPLAEPDRGVEGADPVLPIEPLTEPSGQLSSADGPEVVESPQKVSSRPSSGQKAIELIADEKTDGSGIENNVVSLSRVETISISGEKQSSRPSSGSSLKESRLTDPATLVGEIPGAESPRPAESSSMTSKPVSHPPSGEDQQAAPSAGTDEVTSEVQPLRTEDEKDAETKSSSRPASATTNAAPLSKPDTEDGVVKPPSHPDSPDHSTGNIPPAQVEPFPSCGTQDSNSAPAITEHGSRRASDASQTSQKANESSPVGSTSSLKEKPPSRSSSRPGSAISATDAVSAVEKLSPKLPSPTDGVSSSGEVTAETALCQSASDTKEVSTKLEEGESDLKNVTGASSEKLVEKTPSSPMGSQSSLKEGASSKTLNRPGSGTEVSPGPEEITEGQPMSTELQKSPSGSQTSLKETSAEKPSSRRDSVASCSSVRSLSHPTVEQTPAAENKQSEVKGSSSSPTGSKASLRENEKPPSRTGSSSSLKTELQGVEISPEAPSVEIVSESHSFDTKEQLNQESEKDTHAGTAASESSTKPSQPSASTSEGPCGQQESFANQTSVTVTAHKPPSRSGSRESLSSAKVVNTAVKETRISSAGSRRSRNSPERPQSAGSQSSINASTKLSRTSPEPGTGSDTLVQPVKPTLESSQEPEPSKSDCQAESDASQVSSQTEKLINNDLLTSVTHSTKRDKEPPMETTAVEEISQGSHEPIPESAVHISKHESVSHEVSKSQDSHQPLPGPAVYISKRDSISQEDSTAGRKSTFKKVSSRDGSEASDSPLKLPEHFSDIQSCMVVVGEIEKSEKERDSSAKDIDSKREEKIRQKPPSRPGSSASRTSAEVSIPQPQHPAANNLPSVTDDQSAPHQSTPPKSPEQKTSSRPPSVSSHSSQRRSEGVIIVAEVKPESLGQARISSAGSGRSISSYTSPRRDQRMTTALSGVDNGAHAHHVSSPGSREKPPSRQGSIGSMGSGSSPPTPISASPRVINVAESPRCQILTGNGMNSSGKPPSGKLPKGEKRMGSAESRTSVEGTSEKDLVCSRKRTPSGGSRSSQLESEQTTTKPPSRPGSGSSQISIKLSPKSPTTPFSSAAEPRTSVADSCQHPETTKPSSRPGSNTSLQSSKVVDDVPSNIIVVAESPKGSRHSSFGSRSSLKDDTGKSGGRASPGSHSSINAGPSGFEVPEQQVGGSTSGPESAGEQASFKPVEESLEPHDTTDNIIVVGEAKAGAPSSSRPSSAGSQTSVREFKGSRTSSRRGSGASQASLKIVQQVAGGEGLTVVGDVIVEASALIARTRSGSRPPSGSSTSSQARMKSPSLEIKTAEESLEKPRRTSSAGSNSSRQSKQQEMSDKPSSRKGSLQDTGKGSDFEKERPPLTRTDALPSMDSHPSAQAPAELVTADADLSTSSGVVIDFQPTPNASLQEKDLEKEVNLPEPSVKMSSRPPSGLSEKSKEYKSSKRGSVSSQKSLNDSVRGLDLSLAMTQSAESSKVPRSPSASEHVAVKADAQSKDPRSDSVSASEAVRSPSALSETPGTGVYCPHSSRAGSVVEPSIIIDLVKVAEKLSQQGSPPGSKTHSRQNSTSSRRSSRNGDSPPGSPPSVFESVPKAPVYIPKDRSVVSPKVKSSPPSSVSSPVFEPVPMAAEYIPKNRSVASPKAESPPSSPVAVAPGLSMPSKKKSSPTGSVSSAQNASGLIMVASEAPVPPEVEDAAGVDGFLSKRGSVYSSTRGGGSETSSARGVDIDMAISTTFDADADAQPVSKVRTRRSVSASSCSELPDSSLSETSASVQNQGNNSAT